MIDFPLIAYLKKSIVNLNAPALISSKSIISFKRMFQLIGERQSDFEAFGIVQGDLVGLTINRSDYELIICQLALSNMGAIILPIPITKGLAGRKAIADRFMPKLIVTHNETFAIKNFTHLYLDTFKNNPKKAINQTASNIKDKNPVFITLSSGTMGEIKGVKISHEDMLFRIKHLPMNFNSSTRGIPFDINYALGFASCLKILVCNGSVILRPMRKVPLTDIEVINLFNANYTELSPAQISGMLTRNQSLNGKICNSDLTLRVVGDFFSGKLLMACQQRLTKKLYYSYGLTEMGAISFILPTCAEDLENGGDLISDIQVECVDDDNEPVIKNEIGQIRIRYSEMPSEYFKNPHLSQLKFKDGWYYTGDNGIVTENNKLIIKGRSDDTINLGGTITNLNAIKDTILNIGGIQDAFVFSRKDENEISFLYLALITKENSDPNKIKLLCTSSVKPPPKKIFIVDSFPLNSNGKIDRKKLEGQLI